MEKIKKSFLALVLMLVGIVSAQAQAPEKPKAPDAPKASALVTDGSVVQYLYNVGAKGFLLGANDWNTRASFSLVKGYQFKVAKNSDDDKYMLNDYVENQSAWKAVFADNDASIWVDNLGGANVKGWVITSL